jgi:hypothetical protein
MKHRPTHVVEAAMPENVRPVRYESVYDHGSSLQPVRVKFERHGRSVEVKKARPQG